MIGVPDTLVAFERELLGAAKSQFLGELRDDLVESLVLVRHLAEIGLVVIPERGWFAERVGKRGDDIVLVIGIVAEYAIADPDIAAELFDRVPERLVGGNRQGLSESRNEEV